MSVKSICTLYRDYFDMAERIPRSSVADPGCLSRIPYPDFYPSRIPDLVSRIQTQQQKRGGGGKLVVCYLFFSHKFHIIENYFIIEMPKKKIWANFQRIIELFTQKIVTKLSKIWVWDLGSEMGSGIQGSKKHRIPDPDPQHCPEVPVFEITPQV
jgi:hypothetical protein